MKFKRAPALPRTSFRHRAKRGAGRRRRGLARLCVVQELIAHPSYLCRPINHAANLSITVQPGVLSLIRAGTSPALVLSVYPTCAGAPACRNLHTNVPPWIPLDVTSVRLMDWVQGYRGPTICSPTSFQCNRGSRRFGAQSLGLIIAVDKATRYRTSAGHAALSERLSDTE